MSVGGDDEADTSGRFFRRWAYRPPSEIPHRQFLYGTHYIRRFVSATAAPGGIGKSALAIAELMAMASGKPLLGIMPRQRLRVAYWNGEDPLEETERRVAAAMMHFGLTASDLDGWFHWGSGRDERLIIAEQGRNGALIVRPIIGRVVDEIQRNRLDVVSLDPFVSTHRVPENDNGAIDMVVKEWAAIADQTNSSSDLTHHTRKASGGEMSVEDSRGASAFLNAVRSARVLNEMSVDEAEKAGVNAEHRRWYFRADNGKANLAPPSAGSTWYRFVSVNLGNDPTGPGDSVGVVTPWKWPDTLQGVTAADLLQVQHKIAESEWRDDIRSPAWAGFAVAEALGLNIDSPGVRAKAKGMLRIWLSEGALKRSFRQDGTRKVRAFIEVGTWAE